MYSFKRLIFWYVSSNSKKIVFFLKKTKTSKGGQTHELCEPGFKEAKGIIARAQTSAYWLIDLHSTLSAKPAHCIAHTCQVTQVTIHAILIVSGILDTMLEFWKGIP